MKLMQDLLAESSLLEANGVEVQTIHNMVGVPKKFRKIDGQWDDPRAAKAWMRSHENPKADREAAREAPKKQKEWDKEDRKAEREDKKKPKIDLQKVYNEVMDEIGSVFPDGDPIDGLIPWFERQGINDWEIGDIIAAAMKKHGTGIERKGMYDYMGFMWDEMGKDALHDAKITKEKNGGEYNSPFIEYENGKPHLAANPWK